MSQLFFAADNVEIAFVTFWLEKGKIFPRVRSVDHIGSVSVILADKNTFAVWLDCACGCQLMINLVKNARSDTKKRDG